MLTDTKLHVLKCMCAILRNNVHDKLVHLQLYIRLAYIITMNI